MILFKYTLTFFLLVAVSLSAHAQLSNSNYALLKKELHEQINVYRLENGLSALKSDPILEEAALLQCEYMVKYDTLTHAQKKGKLKTVEKRVKYSKGKMFESIGENILYHHVESFKMNKKDVASLARELFLQWKFSPPHNANMLGTEYTFAGLDIKEDLKKNRIFAAHVFARKGIEVEGQLSSNGFGLRSGPKDCEKQFGLFSNLVLNIGNCFRIEGDEIVFYFHNIELFKRIFNSANDGIAIDMLKRDQFTCIGPNKLDMSKVYDGILLKPVYRNEILANNRAENPLHIISTVGKIPPNFQDYDTDLTGLSTVLISDGKACQYLVNCIVYEEDYELLPVEPNLIDPANVTLSGRGVGSMEQLTFEFNSSEIQPNNRPTFKRSSKKIVGVTIQSYSSVEGDTENNEILHSQRANSIRFDIMTRFNVPASRIQIDSKVNWELMRFQLLYAGADTIADLENDSIQALIASGDSMLNWDSLLYVQRTAVATIYFKDDSSEELSFAEITGRQLTQAIAKQNYDNANKCLKILFKQEEEINSENIFAEGVFDALKNRPELVQNSAALLSKYSESNLYKTTEFVFAWINRKEELSNVARHNLLILYTKIGMQLLDRWDVSSQRLSNVVHPLRMNTIVPENIQAELLLNSHLVYINYYGQINDSEGIQTSFDFISDYFKPKSLSQDEDVKLALFFNSWSNYSSCIDFLVTKYKHDALNETGLLVLATTMNFSDPDNPFYVDVNESLIESNKFLWCEWINSDYQALRNTELKALYCEHCE
ncbi:MAG: CAP domain-containing protein [Crocinitomicaceae bacterium]|nr:CAP domain-containing protein [Crocinitomicaceae bacterium]